MPAVDPWSTIRRVLPIYSKPPRARAPLGLIVLVAWGAPDLLASTLARAEAPVAAPEEAPAAPPAPPPAAPAAAPEGAPLAQHVETPVTSSPAAQPEPMPAASAPETKPAVAAEPEPAEEPKETPQDALPKLKIGFGLRTGLSLSVNNPSDDVQLTLSDGLADQLLIRPYFSGQLTENIGVVANFEFATNGGIGISVLDAIAQVKVVDEFQVWIGQHIPANDRMNLEGPFFHNAWIFEGAVPAYPFDRGARDRGFTLWGLVAGGILKYHLSMVDLQPGRAIENSRFAGRVTINLLDPENYYYASGTYYGAQDTLALGGVIHYQKGTGLGPTTMAMPVAAEVDNDFLAGSLDLLAEKRFGSAGTFTLQALYWNFKGVDDAYLVDQGTTDSGKGFPGPYAVDQAVLAEVTWLTPNKVGIGHLQPGFHVQWADNRDAGEVKMYDLSLGYIIDGYNHRWHINYRHSDSDANGKEDSVQLGVQLQV